MLAPPLAQCEPVSHRRTPRGRSQQVCVGTCARSRHTAATLNHIERHARTRLAWRDEHWGPGFSSRAHDHPQGQGVPRDGAQISRVAMGSTWSAGKGRFSTATTHSQQPTRLAAVDIEELNRGLADLHRRRRGFLRSSGGHVGPGLRHNHQRKGPPTGNVECHPRAHQYGRGLPSTEPGTKALALWQAAQEARDCISMHQWLQTKERSTVPSAGEAAGFELEQEEVVFTDCTRGTDETLVLPVRNTTRGPLRVRLRRKPTNPAFSASLLFPTGAPVAAGLAAELHIVCHGRCIANGGCEDWLELEVEGRARRLALQLIARVTTTPRIQLHREIERRQAVAEVMALPSTL